MPKLFRVTFTKQFEISFVAETQDELDRAVQQGRYDIDDWDDTVNSENWEWSISDVIDEAKKIRNEKRLPTVVHPEMGVCKGKCVCLEVYRKLYPGGLEELEEKIRETSQGIISDRVNLALPFP